MEVLEFFKLKQINFHGNNITKLLNSMSNEDKETFSFDVKDIDWPNYIDKYALGVRKFIFKQDIATLDDCRKKLFWLKILHYAVKIVGIGAIVKIFIRKVMIYFDASNSRMMQMQLLK